MDDHRSRHRRSASVSVSTKNKLEEDKMDINQPPKADTNKIRRNRREENPKNSEDAKKEENNREHRHRHHRRSQSEKRSIRSAKQNSQNSAETKGTPASSTESRKSDTKKSTEEKNIRSRHKVRSPSEPSHRKPIIDQIREEGSQPKNPKIIPPSPTDSIKSAEAERILREHKTRADQQNSPAESLKSAKSFHHKPPPLPLDTPIQIKRSSERRSASEKSRRRRRDDGFIFRETEKDAIKKPEKAEEKQKETYQYETTKKTRPTRHKLLELQQKQEEIEKNAPKAKEQQQQTKEHNSQPHYKSFKEILTEKPQFKTVAKPKPLIGTEYENAKPNFPYDQFAENKKVTPSVSSESVEDQPDDYNARDINKQIQYMERETSTLQPRKKKPRGHVKLEFSAKHRSASESKEVLVEKEKEKEKEKENSENVEKQSEKAVSESDAQNNNTNNSGKEKNISIDGRVIQPPQLQAISSSSDFNAMTGTEIEDPSLQSLHFQRDPPKPQQYTKKKKYRPPELKIFDSQVAGIQDPLSAQVPKANIKLPFPYSASPPAPKIPLQIPPKDVAPQPNARVRRRREHH